MIWFGAMLLTILTGGRIDYLPGAHRPWVVDFSAARQQGHGKTLIAAIRHRWNAKSESGAW